MCTSLNDKFVVVSDSVYSFAFKLTCHRENLACLLFHIVVELFASGALFVVDGVRKAAVDGAQANANIVTRLCDFGSLLRVFVREGING